MTAAILSYAVSHLHEGTGKLRKTCADTVGHSTESVPSLTVSEKWPPAQRFDVQAADRRSPIQVLTQRKAAWLGWSPGTGHLPHTEHCRSHNFFKNQIEGAVLFIPRGERLFPIGYLVIFHLHIGVAQLHTFFCTWNNFVFHLSLWGNFPNWSFLKRKYTLLYTTLNSTLGTPNFRRCFHPLNYCISTYIIF